MYHAVDVSAVYLLLLLLRRRAIAGGGEPRRRSGLQHPRGCQGKPGRAQHDRILSRATGQCTSRVLPAKAISTARHVQPTASGSAFACDVRCHAACGGVVATPQGDYITALRHFKLAADGCVRCSAHSYTRHLLPRRRHGIFGTAIDTAHDSESSTARLR